MQVYFRADASARLGSGHVVRCAALAMALRNAGADCSFVCRDIDGNMIDWLAGQGFSTIALPAGVPSGTLPWSIDVDADAQACGEAIQRTGKRGDWLVVDHYGIDARWEGQLRAFVDRVIVIDDLADRPHAADVLVDQNLHDGDAAYRDLLPAHCRQLIGARFALLRPEFEVARAARVDRAARTERRILACVGGTDPADVLTKVTSAWRRLPAPRPELDIAVGRSSPNAASLAALCAGLDGAHLHLQAPDMARLMTRADLMICAAGSISWERCCLGVPAIMGTTASNQRANLTLLSRRRTGVGLGPWDQVSVEQLTTHVTRLLGRPSLLGRMAERARRIVDGRGAFRVAARMLGPLVRLRRATANDAAKAWSWRNASATRRYSIDPRPVPYERHVVWWDAAIASDARDLMLAVLGDTPVGVLRFDHAEDRATVSIYLDPDLTGLGLGAHVLEAGKAWIAAHRPDTRALVAEILQQNSASIVAFEQSGFVRSGPHWLLETTPLECPRQPHARTAT